MGWMEEKGESISFVNGKNEKIFEIPDGDAIKLISENGDRYYALCRRIDECHVKIDGVRWHLQAYAQAMELFSCQRKIICKYYVVQNSVSFFLLSL